eukprot:gene9616-biopygen6356
MLWPLAIGSERARTGRRIGSGTTRSSRERHVEARPDGERSPPTTPTEKVNPSEDQVEGIRHPPPIRQFWFHARLLFSASEPSGESESRPRGLGCGGPDLIDCRCRQTLPCRDRSPFRRCSPGGQVGGGPPLSVGVARLDSSSHRCHRQTRTCRPPGMELMERGRRGGRCSEEEQMR